MPLPEVGRKRPPVLGFRPAILTSFLIRLIGTGNFVGYLVAALISGRLAARFGARLVICLALATVGLTLMAASRAQDFLGVMVLYFFTGIRKK